MTPEDLNPGLLLPNVTSLVCNAACVLSVTASYAWLWLWARAGSLSSMHICTVQLDFLQYWLNSRRTFCVLGICCWWIPMDISHDSQIVVTIRDPAELIFEVRWWKKSFRGLFPGRFKTRTQTNCSPWHYELTFHSYNLIFSSKLFLWGNCGNYCYHPWRNGNPAEQGSHS